VLARSVQMGTCPEIFHALVVIGVNNGENTEHSSENLLDRGLESLGKWSVLGGREDRVIVGDFFHPGHYVVDIFGSRAGNRLLYLDTVRPRVFEPRREAFADRSTGNTTHLTYNTPQQTNFIEKINRYIDIKQNNGIYYNNSTHYHASRQQLTVGSKPFIQFFSGG